MSHENDISTIGERFVYKHYPKLFDRLRIMKCIWNTEQKGKEKTEGADIEAWLYPEDMTEDGLMEKEVDFTKEAKEWNLDVVPEDSVTKALSIPQRFVRGPIEVKTSSFDQYLAFTNTKYRTRVDWERGMLPFPIWNSFTGEPIRARLGNLYRMFYPKNSEKERQPLAYVAVFLDLDQRPYAALVFEDFLALKYRLIEKGKEKYGLDLTKEGLEKIPCEQEPDGWKLTQDWMDEMMDKNPALLLLGEMWYIQMADVIDLARVVLIGDPPERKDILIKDKYRSPKEIQDKRWNYLKEKSCGDPIPQEVDDEIRTSIEKGEKAIERLKSLPGFLPFYRSWTVDKTTGQTEKRLLFGEQE